MFAKHAAPKRAHGAANRVRIVGGRYRSRLLAFPDGAGLRPTPDRVRETLFNWLGQDLAGWRCVDLFAGSGALGFEAASRGAVRVLMIERDPNAVAALETNRAALGAAVDIVRADALAWLAGNRETFDLAFVDPPFDSDTAASALAGLAPYIASGGYVYVEQASETAAPTGFVVHRSGRAGRSRFTLLMKEQRC
ncbi:MAG: 16S rRNA (guanine(966)-N(2))-methyltransferase RsmD [Thiobacillus sp.]